MRDASPLFIAVGSQKYVALRHVQHIYLDGANRNSSIFAGVGEVESKDVDIVEGFVLDAVFSLSQS